MGFLAGSGPCSDLGNGHSAVVAPSANPGLPLGSGFEGQAPCNVETVTDVEASWVSQTHLMSFNNHRNNIYAARLQGDRVFSL